MVSARGAKESLEFRQRAFNDFIFIGPGLTHGHRVSVLIRVCAGSLLGLSFFFPNVNVASGPQMLRELDHVLRTQFGYGGLELHDFLWRLCLISKVRCK